ncbi:MAG: TonB-dependent receptor [Bryobacterales bacterium]|nr:TonB-dependent receptor [Bryobacterales bacterium]
MKQLIQLLSVCALALPLGAQNIKGGIAGYVSDASRAVVSGAAVEVTDVARGATRHSLTQSDGRFQIPGLENGSYRIRVSAKGFAVYQADAIEVQTGKQVDLVVNLQVVGIASEVTVAAAAALVQSEDSKVSRTFTAEELNDLPARAGGQGRNYYGQVLQVAGVAGATGAHQPFAISGNRSRSNNYLVDSVDSTDANTGLVSGRGVSEQLISQEALASVETLTHNFKAEYGRNSGGVISLITKSGSNDLHGSLYWYHNNSALSARNFFDTTVPKERANLPGITIGGPIVKNRAFLFSQYEAFLIRGTSRQTFQGLTEAEKAAAAPSVRALVNLYPTVPSAAQRIFAIGTPNVTDLHTYLTRGDFLLTSKQTLMGRLSNTESYRESQSVGGLLGSSAQGKRRTLGATVQHSYAMTPRLFNEARIGYNRQVEHDTDTPDPLFLGNPAVNGQMGALRVTGLTALGIPTFLNQYSFQNNYQAMDDLTAIRGRHTWKMGTSVRRIHVNGGNLNSTFRGTLTFNSLTGFLAGTPNAYSIVTGNPRMGLRRTEWQSYIQDDFRVRPNLTLNLGLRYELNTPPVEVAGRIQSQYLLPTDRNNLAPRFGLAYTPWKNTVLRAGYGIYYNVLETSFIGLTRFNPPTLRTFDAVNPVMPNLLAQAQTGLPSGLVIPNQNSATPYAQHLNLTVERQLFHPGASLTAGYVATLGRKLSRTLRPNGGEQLAQSLRPDTRVGVVNLLETSANSDYQSLQVTYNQRMGSAFQLRATYTWSKFLDDVSDIAGSNVNLDRGIIPLDERRLYLDRGISSFDIRHIGTVSLLYRLPLLRGHRFLGGWSVASMTSLQSGRPYTVYTGTNTPLGSNNQRPLAIAGSLVATPDQSVALRYGGGFNATLLRPAATEFGTLGRNTFTGDRFVITSLSLSKDLRWTERFSSQLRAEVFNALNTTSFNTVDSVMSSPTFGRYTTAFDSRRVQLALRLVF